MSPSVATTLSVTSSTKATARGCSGADHDQHTARTTSLRHSRLMELNNSEYDKQSCLR